MEADAYLDMAVVSIVVTATILVNARAIKQRGTMVDFRREFEMFPLR